MRCFSTKNAKQQFNCKSPGNPKKNKNTTKSPKSLSTSIFKNKKGSVKILQIGVPEVPLHWHLCIFGHPPAWPKSPRMGTLGQGKYGGFGVVFHTQRNICKWFSNSVASQISSWLRPALTAIRQCDTWTQWEPNTTNFHNLLLFINLFPQQLTTIQILVVLLVLGEQKTRRLGGFSPLKLQPRRVAWKLGINETNIKRSEIWFHAQIIHLLQAYSNKYSAPRASSNFFLSPHSPVVQWLQTLLCNQHGRNDTCSTGVASCKYKRF